MMDFWIGAAALAGLAIVFVLWPVIRRPADSDQSESRDEQVLDLYNQHRLELQQQLQAGDIDQAQFEQLQAENERSLLEDSSAHSAGAFTPARRGGGMALVLVAFLVAALAVVFYSGRGALADLEIRGLRDELLALPADTPPEQVAARQQALIAHLRARLDVAPENVQNWYMLARFTGATGQFEEAVRAYQQILQRDPEAPGILSELAQVKFLQADNRITPEVRELTGRALALNGRDTTALGLAGIDAFQQQRYADAVGYWERAVALLGPMTPDGQALQQGIARAQRMLPAAGGAVAALPGPERIRVAVTLAPGVTASPEQAVFIYARAWQGSRMPLAIARLTVADLPATVTLDRSMSMVPDMHIGSFAELEVVARISPSGSAVAQAGDWQAVQGPLKASAGQIALTLEIATRIK